MEKVRLGDVCIFQSGGTPPKGNPEYFNGDIPWITTVSLNGSTIGKECAVDWITQKAIKETSAKIVPANSVMVGTRVGVGKVAVNTAEMSTSQDIISLLGIDENKWDKSFLCKFITSKSEYLNAQARGATIKGIKIEVLSNIELPTIQLSEQKKIVCELDKVTNLIAKRKQQLSKLDELVKARFVELFEGKYKTVKLGDVVKTTSGGTPSKAHSEYYENGTIPWLTSGEVNAGVITSVKNCITDLGMKNSSAKMVPANSVVVAMYGATAGVTGLIRIDTTTNQAVCSILPSERFIPEYLYYAVASKKDWMISQCQGGGQPNISQGIIKNMDVIDAPIEEQIRFATFVEQTDKSKSEVQKSLEKLELLKKALMQKYFG